jgi:two-component system, OmpR family, response regulator ChvI
LQTDENNNNYNEISKENISITNSTTHTKKKKPSHKILLVNDDYDILTTIKHCLEDTNDFIVDTFSNPLEVISAFQPEFYDLILIDIKMPKMNGFELYQELRKKVDNVEIRACFITPYEIYYETLKSEFPELNVGCFISEPIESANLVKRIREELQIQV